MRGVGGAGRNPSRSYASHSSGDLRSEADAGNRARNRPRRDRLFTGDRGNGWAGSPLHSPGADQHRRSRYGPFGTGGASPRFAAARITGVADGLGTAFARI